MVNDREGRGTVVGVGPDVVARHASTSETRLVTAVRERRRDDPMTSVASVVDADGGS
ncbi:hypothetical protein [Halovivax limisalsi]|uniref:hypothetical protein n=1 Tax=Halovivax limisalsi TaxID=1453760 RepID=UPI001FFCA9D4|nr:hypothetical protein [Halovivax limisalsi]